MSDDAAKQRRARQTVNNLLYSILATIAVVVVIVLVTPRPAGSLLQPVDYKGAAKEASQSSGYPVLAPALLGKDWYSNSARWTTKTSDGVDSWYVGFVGKNGQYLGLTQAYKANPTWTVLQLPGDLVTGTANFGGIKWDVWQSTVKNDPAKTKDYALVTEVKSGDRTDEVILYGTASKAEFKAFATEVANRLRVLYP